MKKISIIGLIILGAFSWLSAAPANAAEDVVVGRVDWVEGFITAVGYGTANPSASKAQDRIMATRAAMVNAQRALLETLKGVRIDSLTRVENMMVQQDRITAQVSGVLQGAQVLKTDVNWIAEAPLVSVEMRMCLHADRCTSSKPLVAALNLENRQPAQAPQSYPIAPPQLNPSAQAPPKDAPPAVAMPKAEPRPKVLPYDTTKPVTGVIFDLEGRFFERELMPVVATVGDDRQPLTIYSAKVVNPRVMRTYGVVRYYDSVEQAKNNPHLGNNVLIVLVEKVTKENMLVIDPKAARTISETIRYGNDYLSEAKVVIAEK